MVPTSGVRQTRATSGCYLLIRGSGGIDSASEYFSITGYKTCLLVEEFLKKEGAVYFFVP